MRRDWVPGAVREAEAEAEQVLRAERGVPASAGTCI